MNELNRKEELSLPLTPLHVRSPPQPHNPLKTTRKARDSKGTVRIGLQAWDERDDIWSWTWYQALLEQAQGSGPHRFGVLLTVKLENPGG